MHEQLHAWWSGISLRTKITGVTVMLLTLGLLVAGAGTMSLLRSYLLGEVDGRVANAAQVLQVSASRFVNFADAQCLVTSGVGEQAYLAVLSSDGKLLCHNRNPERPVPDLSQITLEAARELGGDTFSIADADRTNQWRAVAVTTTFDAVPGVYTLVVGENVNFANAVVARFAAIFMFFAIAVVVLGGVSTRLLVNSTFAPLRDVEETAARFADGDFSQRMGGSLPNTEVGRLNRSLNAMLARIDRAFADRAETIEQMRRFVGDASHELRTPLVSVRGYAELYRMGALGSQEEVAQAMERIEKEAIRMTALVSDLLELARLDETRPLALSSVDLGVIAHDAAMDARASAPDRQVSVIGLEFPSERNGEDSSNVGHQGRGRPGMARRTNAKGSNNAKASSVKTGNTGPIAFAGAQLARLRALRNRGARDEPTPTTSPRQRPRAIVLAEENKIRQVVTNLMGNAMRFSPDGSPIEIGVGVDAVRGMGVLAVIDHGQGIPPQIREKIFQRFWRADTSRTRETGGSGLGLAIVSAIVGSHSGMVEVDETEGGGATFRILIPLVPADEPSTEALAAS